MNSTFPNYKIESDGTATHIYHNGQEIKGISWFKLEQSIDETPKLSLEINVTDNTKTLASAKEKKTARFFNFSKKEI
jgi:hypothetical protein